ncbi:MAG: AraC family transcriptional regulator [Myxococcales bacterium]|nr:AraC family transcriptional regulator [Myxococcales bacterium]
MAAVPAIASGAIRKLLGALPSLGVDGGDVCAEVAFEASVCESADARVPLELLYALWEAVQRRAPRPDLALVVAGHYSPGDYGLVGFVCMASPNLGEGLRQLVRYARLWTDEPQLALSGEGELRLDYRYPGADRPGRRLAAEAAFAEVLHGARALTQRPLTPEEVELSHPAPADRAAHDAFFGTRVRFGRPHSRLRFARHQLDIPIPQADAQLADFLRELANQALARQAQPRSVPEQVSQLIAEELSQGVPALSTVARRMAMSERTLRRRLAEESTSFRELLDSTRAALGRSYVQDRRLPLTEVAFLLGFSEASAFHRAFKRWTRATPAAFRRNR